MTERWLPIPRFEDRYEVSDLGRVRCTERLVPCRGGKVRRIPTRLLTPEILYGYARVTIRLASGQRRHVRVHRAVLEAFVGPPPTAGHEPCHASPDRLDNRLSNLKWDTRSANVLDTVTRGTHFNAGKTACPRGHLLVMPNLVAAKMALGARSCLACARVIGRKISPGVPEFATLADEYYESIMR